MAKSSGFGAIARCRSVESEYPGEDGEAGKCGFEREIRVACNPSAAPRAPSTSRPTRHSAASSQRGTCTKYGTTLEQWTSVVVSTRAWAALNPNAMNRDSLTIADVLKALMIAYPFTVLNICLASDDGGALVLTRADRTRDCAKKPVYVRGTGEATEHVSVTQMKGLPLSEATRMSGEPAMKMAGVSHGDFDHLVLYDAFTSGPPIMLESMGFAKPGEGVSFFEWPLAAIDRVLAQGARKVADPIAVSFQ